MAFGGEINAQELNDQRLTELDIHVHDGAEIKVRSVQLTNGKYCHPLPSGDVTLYLPSTVTQYDLSLLIEWIELMQQTLFGSDNSIESFKKTL